MNIRSDLERMFRNRDSGLVPGGPFDCVYTEEYEETYNGQGVTRTMTVPRHIAEARGIVPDTYVEQIITVDGRRVGPFNVETYEPDPGGVVVMRLRAGVTLEGEDG